MIGIIKPAAWAVFSLVTLSVLWLVVLRVLTLRAMATVEAGFAQPPTLLRNIQADLREILIPYFASVGGFVVFSVSLPFEQSIPLALFVGAAAAVFTPWLSKLNRQGMFDFELVTDKLLERIAAEADRDELLSVVAYFEDVETVEESWEDLAYFELVALVGVPTEAYIEFSETEQFQAQRVFGLRLQVFDFEAQLDEYFNVAGDFADEAW